MTFRIVMRQFPSIFRSPLSVLHYHGDVAQLGERMNGIHEVRGSIPLVSTNIKKGRRKSASFSSRFTKSVCQKLRKNNNLC